MKKSLFFALALMVVMGLGGLVYESASAQNTNSSTTSMGNMSSNKNMSGRRHRRGRRHGRRHRRGGMGRMPKNSNM